MWSSRTLIAAALAASVAGSAAAEKVSCPPAIGEGAARHMLNNASVFDGPPEQKADLVPEASGEKDSWPLQGIDPYLVCRFARTAEVVTLHATGAKVCEAGGAPFAASCHD